MRAEAGQREIEQQGLRLLSRREHSRVELKRKLLARYYNSTLVEQVLDDLENNGLLSDERYVEHYIYNRKRKGYGPLRIRAELRDRGINVQLIEANIDKRDDDWRMALKQVAQNKAGDPEKLNYDEKTKLARFLEYRGFPLSLIRDYLFD